MGPLPSLEDKDRDLTYTVTFIKPGVFHAKCNEWPQLTFSASTFLDALDGIKRWSKLKYEDKIFYERKAIFAKQLYER